MSDLFVFPSTTDTFGMVILEGLACGLPAVVTDVGGPQELVRHGETGLVLKAGDREAWIAGIVGLMDTMAEDPDAYAAMRENARRSVAGRYSWEQLLDDVTGPAPGR
jgi:glycosyltransferase involved in cell wall biosynthesis